MKPMADEPCNKCKHWDGRTKEGCKIGRYNSAAMVIWGACGMKQPKTKRTKKTEEQQ